jgi:transposase
VPVGHPCQTIESQRARIGAYYAGAILVARPEKFENSRSVQFVGSPASEQSAHHHLAAHLFGSSKLFADDTPIPVLDPGRGRTKTGRLWVYARDDRPKTFQISERADHLR